MNNAISQDQWQTWQKDQINNNEQNNKNKMK